MSMKTLFSRSFLSVNKYLLGSKREIKLSTDIPHIARLCKNSTMKTMWVQIRETL